MKIIVLIALGLLLSGQTAAQKTGFDPRLAVTVTAKSGTVVVVRGPEVDLEPDPDFSWEWEKPSVLPNKSGSFIAVHYYGNLHVKYWDANVFLVRPDGRTERLKKDTVLKIQWTEDGRYLVGTGGNTIRVWNLNGGLRQVRYQDIRASSVAGKTLCLNVNWYSPTTGQLNRSTEIRLSLPSLKQLSIRDIEGDSTCMVQP